MTQESVTPRRSVERLRSYWSERARNNAMWYVDTSLRYDAPDRDTFMATGQKVVRIAFVDAPVKPEATTRALEIGSGLGRMCAALSEHFDDVVGIDISPEMVEQAGSIVDLPNVSFVLGDGASLSGIETSTVDLVVSFTVFQHIPDPKVISSYLQEAGRVLRPGGVLACQWNNQPGARRWAVRRALLAFLQRTGIRRERYGRNAAEFLGSRVSLNRMREMLADAGLELEATENTGTLFAWAWARPAG